MTESEDQAIYHLLGGVDEEEGCRSISTIIEYLLEVYWETTFAKPELERAAVQCLDWGWLKILSERDCQEDSLRWVDDPHQNWSEFASRPGEVDFTLAGWQAYVNLAKRLGEPSPEEHCRERGQYLWRTPGYVSLISVSKQLLLEDLAEVLAGTDCLVANGLSAEHTITNTTGPYRIGPWWVKRRYLAPYGYRVDISFTPADTHYLSVS